MNPTRNARDLLFYLMALALVFLQYRGWRVGHASNMEYLTTAMDGVLHGTPHWRAYQNRLLAPLIYSALNFVTPQGYVIFVQISLTALGLSLYGMLKKLGVDNGLALTALSMAVLLWTLEQYNSFYLWDLIDAGWMLALVYLSMTDKLKRWIYVVFAIALLNRESALFVAASWGFSGLAMWSQDRATAKSRIKQGAVMGLLVVIFVEAVRKTLFQHSMLTGVWTDDAHKTFENHIKLIDNIGFIIPQIKAGSPLVFTLVFYAAILIVATRNAIRSRHADLTGSALALSAYFLSLFVFGAIGELRLYQPFVWVLALLLFAGSKPRGTVASQRLPPRRGEAHTV